MKKQRIIKTKTNTFKTTEKTVVSENSGNYYLSGIYIKSGKERSGEVFIPITAIDHIETIEIAEKD